MKQQLHLLTIGVENLDSLKDWYVDKFGWQPLKTEGDIVFFQLNGFILAFFPKRELAKDIGTHHGRPGFKRCALSICYNSAAEVDAELEKLRQKGVEVVREAETATWGGYRAYVADLENNYWELAYNPWIQQDGDGNVIGHTC